MSAATNGTGVVQPLTQLLRVKAANDVARAEAEATRGKARSVEDETALRVHQNLLPDSDCRRPAPRGARQDPGVGRLQRERVQQVRYGSALEAELIESRAHALQARQELLTTELQRSDLQMQLNDIIGLPLTTPLLLDPNVSMPGLRALRARRLRSRGARLASGDRGGARAGREGRFGGPAREVRVRPGCGGVRALQLPEQRAVPGRSLRHSRPSRERRPVRWRPGSRRSCASATIQLEQANENLARISDEVELRVQTAYNKMERTRQVIAVSEDLLALRAESRRVGRRTACTTAARLARRQRSPSHKSSRRGRRFCNRSSITCKRPTRWMRRSDDGLDSGPCRTPFDLLHAIETSVVS